MTKISSSDVQKVAQLARLELPEDQIETYTAQIEEILSYIDQLQEIDTKNMEKVEKLNRLKNQIESLDKHNQIEILKILSRNLCKLNENKSGVYVNMSFLDDKIIEEVEDYLRYMKEQEDNLITTEYQKKEFMDSYFIEKEDKRQRKMIEQLAPRRI